MVLLAFQYLLSFFPNSKNMSRLTVDMHPSFTEPILKALFVKNIYTVLVFVKTEIKFISSITNLSYKEVLSIQRHLINKHSAVVHNGLEYYRDVVQKTAIIQTGIKNLDGLLEGGLLTGNVYEVCGLPANGKTQFCLTLAKNVVENLKLFVYYIDTKGDFSGRKLKSMLEAENATETHTSDVMLKILVKTVYSQYELINCLHGIMSELCNGLKLRLIIIDSLPPLFYQSSDVTKNNGIMNHLVNVMQFLAKEYHVVFVVVNVITTWYEGDFSVERSFTEKLGLGKYWLSVPNVRLMIKLFIKEINRCDFVIMKSNKHLKGSYCTVNIGNVGIY